MINLSLSEIRLLKVFEQHPLILNMRLHRQRNVSPGCVNLHRVNAAIDRLVNNNPALLASSARETKENGATRYSPGLALTFAGEEYLRLLKTLNVRNLRDYREPERPRWSAYHYGADWDNWGVRENPGGGRIEHFPSILAWLTERQAVAAANALNDICGYNWVTIHPEWWDEVKPLREIRDERNRAEWYKEQNEILTKKLEELERKVGIR